MHYVSRTPLMNLVGNPYPDMPAVSPKQEVTHGKCRQRRFIPLTNIQSDINDNALIDSVIQLSLTSFESNLSLVFRLFGT
jgi:hypothetical protein